MCWQSVILRSDLPPDGDGIPPELHLLAFQIDPVDTMRDVTSRRRRRVHAKP